MKILISWISSLVPLTVLAVVTMACFGWVATPIDGQLKTAKSKDYVEAGGITGNDKPSFTRMREDLSRYPSLAVDTSVWLYDNWDSDIGVREVQQAIPGNKGMKRGYVLYNGSDSPAGPERFFAIGRGQDGSQEMFAGSPVVSPLQPLVLGYDERAEALKVGMPLLFYTGSMIGKIFLHNFILLFLLSGYLVARYLAMERRLSVG